MTQKLDLNAGIDRLRKVSRMSVDVPIDGVPPEIVRELFARIEQAEADRENWKTTAISRGERAEQAEQQVQAVLRLADDWEAGALRWEDPLRVPEEVFLLREALQQPTHKPDWTDYQLGDPGASCSCGYNGPYKECWQSRRALDGEQGA